MGEQWWKCSGLWQLHTMWIYYRLLHLHLTQVHCSVCESSQKNYRLKQSRKPLQLFLISRVEPRLFQWPYQSTYHLPISLSDSSSCPLFLELCSIHRSSLALPSKAAILCLRCVCNLLLALLPDGLPSSPYLSLNAPSAKVPATLYLMLQPHQVPHLPSINYLCSTTHQHLY